MIEGSRAILPDHEEHWSVLWLPMAMKLPDELAGMCAEHKRQFMLTHPGYTFQPVAVVPVAYCDHLTRMCGCCLDMWSEDWYADPSLLDNDQRFEPFGKLLNSLI
jgi:hypothetical protein